MPRMTSRAAFRFLLAVLAASPAVAAAHPAAAAEPAKASWIKIDADAKKVTFDVEAAWNANNSNLNFNGYFDGDATIVVPVGWAAEFNFTNQDAALPHSLLVTKAYEKGEYPTTAGRNQVAIPRAYTRNPESGIAAGETDSFDFTANAPGDYDLICGAPGHAQAGMWIHLSLSKDAKSPGVIAAKGASGRP